jgi:hypothetical protein
MEVSWKEVGEILEQGVRKVERMRRSIAENAKVIWSDAVPERAGTVGVNNGGGGGQMGSVSNELRISVARSGIES